MLTHFAADIDIAGPGHAAENLPPDIETALAIADAVRPPSLVIASGGGLYAVWRLVHPVDITTPEARAKMSTLARALDEALARQVVDGHRYHVDRTQELSRHLRIPGTTNRKPGRGPRPVRVLRGHLDEAAGGDITLDELEEIVAKSAPAPPPPPRPASRWPGDDTATPWAILAERYSVDEILATDPLHRWEKVADEHLGGVSRPAWRRVGSAADYSIKLGDHGLIVWSASFAAELGIAPGSAITPYRLLRHFAGVSR